MHIFYRLSDSSNVRERVPAADKFNCLENFFVNFKLTLADSMFLLADNVEDATWNYLRHHSIYPFEIILKRTNSGSEAASFKLLLDAFSKLAKPSEFVYFAEDDYIYLPNSRAALDEGLMLGDYATLRLHPDKFIPPAKGGNPLLDAKGGEATRVYQGIDHFWMLTNSTGMYPATSAKIMREDLDIWYWGVTQGKASRDFEIWLKLRDKGRTLVMPIPSVMSHNDLASESPLIGTGICCWEKALHGVGCDHV